jgi:HK97 gp10 family phage protein
MAKIQITSNASEVAKSLTQELEQYSKSLKLTVFRALGLLEAEILQNIRSKSGLKVRSGSLLNSIGASKKVTEENGVVVGEIGPQGIPYAAIHEFGGTTSPHRIEPRTGKALAFQMGGETVFARFVNHPGSKIPARPYLRPALAAKENQIKEHFGLFLYASFKKRG